MKISFPDQMREVRIRVSNGPGRALDISKARGPSSWAGLAGLAGRADGPVGGLAGGPG